MSNPKKNDTPAAELCNDLSRQLDQWQDAYLRLSRDAALGRLFRGSIHNLNGVTQAFSMQAELLGMMFDQAEVMLRYMLGKTSEPEIKENLQKLHDLLSRRTCLVNHMVEKVRQAQTIVRHSASFPQESSQDVKHETINEIIKDELEFLQADLFFKHKVKQELRLADNLPRLKRYHIEMHQIFFRLLINSLEAIRNSGENAGISIITKLEDKKIKILITDTGPGIPPENLPRIYEPFFTTREDHAGVGLYVVKKIIRRCGGVISCISKPGSTCFQLSFPPDL